MTTNPEVLDEMNLKVSDERATRLREMAKVANGRVYSLQREHYRAMCADAIEDLLDDLAALKAEVARLKHYLSNNEALLEVAMTFVPEPIEIRDGEEGT